MIGAKLIDADHRGGLGHAVALKDFHSQGKKDLCNLRIEGGAAGDVDIRTTAENIANPGADLLVEETGYKRVKNCRKAGRAGQTVFAAKTAPTDVNRPPEDFLHKGRLS